MRERGVPGGWARTVLVLAMGVLLSAEVAIVLIAVTESVLWPVYPARLIASP